MAIDKKVYALANGYTDETVIGGGAIKGKNCTISKIEEIEGGNRITFSWTLDNGTTKSQTLDVMNGEDGYTPIKDVDYFDGEKGDKGDAGNGITTITKTSTAGIVDTYTILFDDGDTTTFNVVNGANITKVSELENDEDFVKATTISLVNYYLKDEAYSKSQIDELLRNVGAGLSVKIVTELPTTEISGTTIYLINTSGSNYNQYMYIDGSWANLGSTAVDMSSYYNKTQIDNKLEDYVTANRLTNKLDDYVLKTGLSKVGKSNSYNDLDDLPEIPDVSGLKPYVETLQDSVNTAPVSKVVYDAVQELNEAIENAGKIDDDATATDSTWSSKKINDSLVDKVPFKLGIDENGNYGYYKAGADTVTPFKSGEMVVIHGKTAPSGTQVDIVTTKYCEEIHISVGFAPNFITIKVDDVEQTNVLTDYGTDANAWGLSSGIIKGNFPIGTKVSIISKSTLTTGYMICFL